MQVVVMKRAVALAEWLLWDSEEYAKSPSAAPCG